MDKIFNVLYELVPKYCKGDVNDETDLYDHGLDSLNSIQLLVDIEECFGISFEEDDLDIHNVKTINHFHHLIQLKMEEKINYPE